MVGVQAEAGARVELAEYLTEMRASVCSRCVERPPGGPPCEPLGKNCGVELHLPELIDSIHQVHSNLLGPYLDHNRAEICEKCTFLHSSICPCPMDYLSALVVEAVETVDERRACGRFAGDAAKASPPQQSRAGLAEVRQAYREGMGTWKGCDWPTRFGKTGLDLQGWRAIEAGSMAETSVGPVAEDWLAAARWLALIEEHAKQAEASAAAAVAVAEDGNWSAAVQFAERAWAFEFATGRAMWHSFPLAWQRLLRAAKVAFLDHLAGAR